MDPVREIAVVNVKENFPLASVVVVNPFPPRFTVAPEMGWDVFRFLTTPVSVPVAANPAAQRATMKVVKFRVRK
jgi:hypothetical protein